MKSEFVPRGKINPRRTTWGEANFLKRLANSIRRRAAVEKCSKTTYWAEIGLILIKKISLLASLTGLGAGSTQPYAGYYLIFCLSN
jgi:hypothetical protein